MRKSPAGGPAMRLARYQPGQAGCFGVPVDVIEPCGFPWGDKALKRAGMDYAEITKAVTVTVR